jgi:hypothetical protein
MFHTLLHLHRIGALLTLLDYGEQSHGKFCTTKQRASKVPEIGAVKL